MHRCLPERGVEVHEVRSIELPALPQPQVPCGGLWCGPAGAIRGPKDRFAIGFNILGKILHGKDGLVFCGSFSMFTIRISVAELWDQVQDHRNYRSLEMFLLVFDHRMEPLL